MTSTPRLQPLATLDKQALARVDYLLFDVDETFTTHGLMHARPMPRCSRCAMRESPPYR